MSGSARASSRAMVACARFTESKCLMTAFTTASTVSAGTAAEVSSVNSVDDREIPCPGPKTRAIAETYARAVRGQDDRYTAWCEVVD